jgi:hypothetical protein
MKPVLTPWQFLSYLAAASAMALLLGLAALGVLAVLLRVGVLLFRWAVG